MENNLTYRVASMADIAQLKSLALVAYGQFSATLGADNWLVMESNLSNEEKIAELLSIATCYVCQQGASIIGMAYFVPSGNPTTIFHGRLELS